MPGRRALAAGRIPNVNDEYFGYAVQDLEQDKNISKNNLYGQAVLHTISSFFGWSGAMVATWSAEEYLPVVIGLSKSLLGNPTILADT